MLLGPPVVQTAISNMVGSAWRTTLSMKSWRLTRSAKCNTRILRTLWLDRPGHGAFVHHHVGGQPAHRADEPSDDRDGVVLAHDEPLEPRGPRRPRGGLWSRGFVRR